MQKKSLVAGWIVVASSFFLLGRLSVPAGSSPSRVDSEALPSVRAPSAPPSALELDYDAARMAIPEERKGEEPVVTPQPHDIDVNEALGILEKAIRDHPVSEPTERAFGDKYKNATLGDLQTALTVLRGMEEKSREKLVQQRLDDGIYEVLGPGEQRTTEHKPGDPPKASGYRQEMRNGEMVTLWTTVSGDEYPEYGAIYSELWWVRNRVYSMLHPPEK